jgi:hypothetical protein
MRHGLYKSPLAMMEMKMPAPLDLKGLRFGRLAVIEQNGKTNTGFRKWDCICDCGASVNVAGTSLTSGNTTSCGCYLREQKSKQMKARKRHGMSRTPEHGAWLDMRRRCEDANRAQFKDYGDRGISVCKRWQVFENFYADMGSRPSPRHSVGRINNNKGYSPSNCRWETPEQQSLNRRSNLLVTAYGRTGPLSTFIDNPEDYKLVHKRLARGWPVELALKLPRGSRWKS